MILYLYTPRWIRSHYRPVAKGSPLPEEWMAEVKERLQHAQSAEPLVTVAVIGYNEEEMILSSLSSLADQVSPYPFEIIVSNNNSTDRTQEILEKVGVRFINEKRQGVGWARKAALDLAKGAYCLNADGDVLYPPGWIRTMTEHLQKPGVSAVYSVDSYIPDDRRKRPGLLFYELSRDISHCFKRFNRIELNVGGGSFGFRTADGRNIGWRTDLKRGEDGSMAYSLKGAGRVKLVGSPRARIWSTTRSLQGQGNLIALVIKRMKKEINRLKEYFQPAKEGYRDRESNLIKPENPPASQEKTGDQ